jgi:hypothetical protein
MFLFHISILKLVAIGKEWWLLGELILAILLKLQGRPDRDNEYIYLSLHR